MKNIKMNKKKRKKVMAEKLTKRKMNLKKMDKMLLIMKK
jgi:hypothetical protein